MKISSGNILKNVVMILKVIATYLLFILQFEKMEVINASAPPTSVPIKANKNVLAIAIIDK